MTKHRDKEAAPESLLLRPKQVMARLNVSRRCLYQMVTSKKLPPPVVIHARAVAWRAADIDKFVQSLAVAPAYQHIATTQEK